MRLNILARAFPSSPSSVFLILSDNTKLRSICLFHTMRVFLLHHEH